MSIELDVQIACDKTGIPDRAKLKAWVEAALCSFNKPFELTIRIVDEEESQSLNFQYRGKDSPTNVLSFPFEVPNGVEIDLIGDLIICASVVEKEFKEQDKTPDAHWSHMVIHGCLHLLGFDHVEDQEAEEMESLEIDILRKLGFNNPYEEIVKNN